MDQPLEPAEHADRHGEQPVATGPDRPGQGSGRAAGARLAGLGSTSRQLWADHGSRLLPEALGGLVLIAVLLLVF